MALQRLQVFERKLNNNSTLTVNAQKQIDHYIQSGYAEKLSEDQIKYETTSWYLPIFNVINHNKPEKFRLVWDAAAKINNTWLNDILLKDQII